MHESGFTAVDAEHIDDDSDEFSANGIGVDASDELLLGPRFGAGGDDLDLPPTAAVGLGVGLLFVFIAGGLGVPGLKTIADIGLYPFAQVYELFVVLLLLAEGVTLAVSFVAVSQLSFLSNVGPSSPQLQAALGLGIAASFVAVTFYDLRGENGYYYATGEYHRPSVDYEKFREIINDGKSDVGDSAIQVTDMVPPESSTDGRSQTLHKRQRKLRVRRRWV